MLIDEIKARMNRAMRERDEVVKNVLGLAVGESRRRKPARTAPSPRTRPRPSSASC